VEVADPVADRLEHPLHLAVAPLVEHELDLRRRERAHARRRGDPVLEHDALGEPPQRDGRGRAVHVGDVDLLDPVLRVREPVRERAVVREQQRAGGVDVEAPDRDDARLVPDHVDHRSPPLRVARRRHDPLRLVEQDVPQPLHAHALAVHLHAVGGAHVGVELAARAVHRHAARFDQIVGRTAGGDTGPGEVRIQAHPL
jgi:hypothetical protein